MAELPLLPIEPSSRSLSSHIAAFNQLIAQLETITSRTRWQAQIPLNGKARVRGEVEHTNDVKVCLGAGWWVEMTAREAVDYLNRKKLGEW
jgi:prefoldin subunit 5